MYIVVIMRSKEKINKPSSHVGTMQGRLIRLAGRDSQFL
jgi:hypothetical protein